MYHLIKHPSGNITLWYEIDPRHLEFKEVLYVSGNNLTTYLSTVTIEDIGRGRFPLHIKSDNIDELKGIACLEIL